MARGASWDEATNEVIEVPAAFIESTVAREGSTGEAWISNLPNLVQQLCARWDLIVDGAPMHGYVGLVVPVSRAETPLVLKVSWIDRSSQHEVLALRTWDGEGAVQVVEALETEGAMLLERLDSEKSLEYHAMDDAVRIAGGLLRRLAVPAPKALRPMGEDVARLRAQLSSAWDELGRPFPQRLRDAVQEWAETPKRHDPPLIINQDLHYGNVLGGSREPWLVIDPKPLAGDPEYGMAQLLWTRFDAVNNRAALRRRWRVQVLVETAELDAQLAQRWSLVRIIQYWIWSLRERDSRETQRSVGAWWNGLCPSLPGPRRVRSEEGVMGADSLRCSSTYSASSLLPIVRCPPQ